MSTGSQPNGLGFKVGDKVRCIKPSFGQLQLVLGNIYTIRKVMLDTMISLTELPNRKYFDDRFELAQPAPLATMNHHIPLPHCNHQGPQTISPAGVRCQLCGSYLNQSGNPQAEYPVIDESALLKVETKQSCTCDLITQLLPYGCNCNGV